MAEQENRDERRVLAFLGLGLDNKDGHHRLTRTEHFLLLGGSAETHERMQDTAIRFTEALRRRGKRLQETPLEELLEILEQEAEN